MEMTRFHIPTLAIFINKRNCTVNSTFVLLSNHNRFSLYQTRWFFFVFHITLSTNPISSPPENRTLLSCLKGKHFATKFASRQVVTPSYLALSLR
jgi:hypothetical protein